MAEKENGERKEEFSFVTEQIMPSKGRIRRRVRKVLEAVFLAVIFGAVAGVTFAFVYPIVLLETQKNELPRETVTIPRDEQPTASEETEPEATIDSETEPESETQTETESTTETTEAVEEIVNNVLEERKLTIEDYGALYNSMYSVVTTVNQSIVTVTSSQNSMDWFNNTYESSEESSGLLYNKTDTELLIMTDAESIHNANDITVTFYDGTKCEAVLRKRDTVTNLAVLSVDVTLLEPQYLETVRTASLGNSYTVKQGDPVIAVGNPMGYNYSMSYGVVTNTRNTTQTVDSNLRLINTTALSDSSGNGFLISLKGEVMGIITKEYKSESSSNIVTAIAVSDIKGILELLSNEKAMPYFGVVGQDATADIAQANGIPLGIYVAEAATASPVYQAGIQSGDVIVSINGQEVKTMRGLRGFLENCAVGETVTVTIMRAGRDEYKCIDVEVTLTER